MWAVFSPGQQPSLASSPNISILSWFLYPRTDTAFYCCTLALLLHDFFNYYNIIPFFNRHNLSLNKSSWCTISSFSDYWINRGEFASIQYFIHKTLRIQDKFWQAMWLSRARDCLTVNWVKFNFFLHLW